MPDPRPAATVVVLRPSGQSFEVLMVERNARGFFGRLHVFPGGGVDELDAPDGDLLSDGAHRRAALRELAEETGLLATGDGMVAAPLVRGEMFSRWKGDNDVTLATDDLVLISRWMTPEGAPKRYDTRFYLLVCQDPPEVSIDREELVDHEWVEPSDALSRADAGEWKMWLPTLAHLRWLSRRSSIADAVASADGADGRSLILPRQGEDGSIIPVHLPAEPT